MKADYFGPKDAERLEYTDFDEAVEGMLDEVDGDELPDTLVVVGYVRQKAGIDPAYVLTHVLETLDEELGNPDGDYSEGTEKMKAAAKVFCDVVISEYVPWACDPVGEEVVDVQKWLRGESGKRG